MQPELIPALCDRIRSMRPLRPMGYVAATEAGAVLITGLGKYAALGDRVQITTDERPAIWGEVVQIADAHITVMPDGPLTGLTVGARVLLQDELQIAPSEAWRGRVIDPNGQPLDDKPLLGGTTPYRLRGKPPAAAKRGLFGRRLKTGSYALNTVLPLVEGQRLGLFAGSGVGKSSLLGTMVKTVDCDVIVVAMIGERGRELRHFTEKVLGTDGLQKCVIVAATSDRPALERRRCIWTAMGVAEYFRDQGKSVLFLADSITRFAEAHREIASAAGEVPVLRGHPPSTSHLITELCERAGPGLDGSGTITAVMSVLVQGSDMEEPIADILRGVLDGHIVLTRDIAERGRYPAIDLLKSVSRSLPEAASKDENDIILTVRRMVATYEENALMAKSGLYTTGADPDLDTALKVWPEIDAFLGTTGPADCAQSFDKLRLILRRNGVSVNS